MKLLSPISSKKMIMTKTKNRLAYNEAKKERCFKQNRAKKSIDQR